MTRLTSSPRLYWLLQALGWGLYGLMGLVLVVMFGQFSPLLPAIELIVAGTMLGVSHLLRLYMRRHGWARLPLAQLLPRLLLANAAVTVGGLALIAGLIGLLLLALPPAARAGQGFQ